MKVADIIKRVRTAAGDMDAMQFSDNDILSWINDAMRECVADNQLLQKSATSTSVSGQSDYDLPTDILKLYSIIYEGIQLEVVTFDYATQEGMVTNNTGTPQVCWVWAGKLTLAPAPASEGSIKVSYTRYPKEVNGEQDIPELPVAYHMRLVDYCLAQVAQQDDDMNRYQFKMQEFRTGVSNLKDQPEWENNAYPFMGISDRDAGYPEW